jgi:hypothetical protein
MGCQYLGMRWVRRVDVEIVALLADVLEIACRDTRGAISFRALIGREVTITIEHLQSQCASMRRNTDIGSDGGKSIRKVLGSYLDYARFEQER